MMEQEATSRTLLLVASAACQSHGSQEAEPSGTMNDIQLSDSTAAADTGQAHSQDPALLPQRKSQVLSNTALPDQRTQPEVHQAELQAEQNHQTHDQVDHQQCGRPEQQQQQLLLLASQHQRPPWAAAGSSTPSADGPVERSVRDLLQRLMSKHQQLQQQQLQLAVSGQPITLPQQQQQQQHRSNLASPSMQQLMAPSGLQSAATLRDQLIEKVSQQVLEHVQQHPQQELPAVLQQQCRLLLHQVKQRVHQDHQLIIQLQRLLLGTAVMRPPPTEAPSGAISRSNKEPDAVTNAGQLGCTAVLLAGSQQQQQQQQGMQEAIYQQLCSQLRTCLMQSRSVPGACTPSDSALNAGARLASDKASDSTPVALATDVSAAGLEVSIRATPAWQQLAPSTQEELQLCLHSLAEARHPALLQQQQQSLRAVPGQVLPLRCRGSLPAELADPVGGSFTSTQTYQIDRSAAAAAAASGSTGNAALLQHLASASKQLLGPDLHRLLFSSQTTATPFSAAAAANTSQVVLQQPAFASQSSLVPDYVLGSFSSQVPITGAAAAAAAVGHSFTQQRQQQPLVSPGLWQGLSWRSPTSCETLLQQHKLRDRKGPDMSAQNDDDVSAAVAAALASVAGAHQPAVAADTLAQHQNMNANSNRMPEQDWSAQQGKLLQQQQQQAVPQHGAEAPLKRKRGRPRKHPLPDADGLHAACKRGKGDRAAAAQTILEDQGAIPALKAALELWGCTLSRAANPSRPLQARSQLVQTHLPAHKHHAPRGRGTA